MSCLPLLNQVAGKYSARWSGLASGIRRIDLAFNTAPEEIPDHCKTLCESILKQVLVETRTNTDEEVDSMKMPDLTARVCQILQFDQAHENIVKSEISYINQLRNASGIAGHGRSLQKQTQLRSDIKPILTTRVLSLSDSLLTAIVERFEERFLNREIYEIEKNNVYDSYLDENYGSFAIEDAEYPASEVLYSVDTKAYANGLKNFKEVIEETE